MFFFQLNTRNSQKRKENQKLFSNVQDEFKKTSRCAVLLSEFRLKSKWMFRINKQFFTKKKKRKSKNRKIGSQSFLAP
jgi:hypothetical protein